MDIEKLAIVVVVWATAWIVVKARAKRFATRLNDFVNTGVWKIRTEIKITDEDNKLQRLLVYFTKENLDLESLSKQLVDKKYFKVVKEELQLSVLLKKAREKIQTELKRRGLRRKKRKIAFLID